MASFPRLILGCFAFAGILAAQANWRTATDLPMVDMSSLSPAQRQLALKIMREQGCSCQCNMKIAECRVVDPRCTYSRGLASVIIENVRAGKTEPRIVAAMAASKFAHLIEQPPERLLEDPVPLRTGGAPELGPKDARVTLVEFSDFQCPYCAKAAPQVEAILKAYPKDVKLFYKQFPLDTHPQAKMAAEASLAAFKQGKFWELHDKMFANYRSLSRENVLVWAKALGLDMPRFEKDMNSPLTRAVVERDTAEGDQAGVEGTPTIFVDGKRFNGPIDLQVLKPVLDAELKQPATRRDSAALRSAQSPTR